MTFDAPNTVYGSADTQERCAKWAKKNGYRLLSRIKYCQHILNPRKRCPSSRRKPYPRECDLSRASNDGLNVFDHARVWQRTNGSRFILSHVYPHGRLSVKETARALEEAQQLARTRGLLVTVDPSMDWYGPGGTIPFRFELPNAWAVIGSDEVV